MYIRCVETVEQNLILYAARIDGLRTDSDRYDSWVILALLTRDDLEDDLEILNTQQKKRLEELDEELKLLKDVISLVLSPENSSDESYPQNRWWWFLNHQDQ